MSAPGVGLGPTDLSVNSRLLCQLSYPGSEVTVLPRRFWAKVEYDPSGCLIWTGARTQNGYGSWGLEGRTRSTHRTAYEALVGPVPDGLQLDHSCRVRHCCNPLHLEPVTSRQNQERSPYTPIGKTHCKYGHPLSGDNLYVHARGSRICVTCRARHQQQARERGPAQPCPEQHHGSKHGYSYYRCRCDPCVAAYRAYYRERMASRRKPAVRKRAAA